VFELEFADAIALLRAEHRMLEQLLATFGEVADTRRRDALARDISEAFRAHLLVETEIFYPAFGGLVTPDAGRDTARSLIEVIDAAWRGAGQAAAVQLIAAEVARHVQEEEELPHGLFAQCRASGRDLVALRDRMLARKDELDAEAARRARSPVRLYQPDLSAA
jgi:hypothetical protein